MKKLCFFYFLLFIIYYAVIIFECISKTYSYLLIVSNIINLNGKHVFSVDFDKLRHLVIGGNGFSNNCDWNLAKTRKRFRGIGANILKIKNADESSIFLSYYRTNISVYKCDGNTSLFQQISLQQN